MNSVETDSIVSLPRFDARILDSSEWILDLLPIGVLVCDRGGVITRHNRAAADLWGRKPKPGDSLQQFCGTSQNPDVGMASVADVLKGGVPLANQIIHCKRPDGSPISLLLNLHPLNDPLGNAIGAVACVQDVNSLSRMLPIALQSAGRAREGLEALPVAVYGTDADGAITFYNQAAVELWGRRPEIGKTMWCGSWQLYGLDGKALAHDESSLAVALRERRPISGAEAVLERPDGTRVRFRAYPTPLFDEGGTVVGALNTLIDVTQFERAVEIRERLVSIVESSQDAIVAKDLNGIITSWNHGAEQLFGYTPEEVIGRPVTILIPFDHLNEEPEILGRIRRGEKVNHYETVRRRKDGSLVDVSLMVSPVKDREGRIVGASKIARDITERRRAEEQRQLLLREMNHRIKNLFSLASGVVTLSARSAETPEDLATAVRERLTALARAHDLTLPDLATGALKAQSVTNLHSLVATIVSPFEESGPGQGRVAVSGPDVKVGVGAITAMALLLHEFATNAAKYGAFSVANGHIKIDWSIEKNMLLLQWEEQGGPLLEPPPEGSAGFGTMLARRIVGGQLGGRISHIWNRSGLTINLSVPLAVLSD